MRLKSRILWGVVTATCFCGRVDAETLLVSNFGNNTITVYDVSTGALLGTPVMAGAEAIGITGVRVTPDGGFVVAAQSTNTVVKYGVNGALQVIFDPANIGGLNSPQDLSYGPDGKLYVVSAGNDKILRYDPLMGSSLGTFTDLGGQGHIGPVGLAFGPDGNWYVSGFDNDQIVAINGQTGTIIRTKQGPPGIGFGPAAFGPDGSLFVVALNLNTFAGSIYRYDIRTDTLTLFIPEGSGGLVSPGAITFGIDGNLLGSNLVTDISFNDIGSTILKYSGQTGVPLGTVVSVGKGLNIPFFMTTDVQVQLDIKPGEKAPVIQSKSRGTTPVAILSSATFDAVTGVDTPSLKFGATGTEKSLAFCNRGGEDVDRDGRLDLVCHVDIALTGLQPTNTIAFLSGYTKNGVTIHGQETVVVH